MADDPWKKHEGKTSGFLPFLILICIKCSVNRIYESKSNGLTWGMLLLVIYLLLLIPLLHLDGLLWYHRILILKRSTVFSMSQNENSIKEKIDTNNKGFGFFITLNMQRDASYSGWMVDSDYKEIIRNFMCHVKCQLCVTAWTASHEPQTTIDLYYLYFLICNSLLVKSGIIIDDDTDESDDDNNDNDDDDEARKQWER